jgi:UDP-N-acetylmuramoyl-L-alanyl-D-glutamate--2,6-diaminopimelate ligase
MRKIIRKVKALLRKAIPGSEGGKTEVSRQDPPRALREVIQNIKVLRCTADPGTRITGVCYDSRKVQPGDLFVAVRGFSSDGHRFIPMAREKGAAAILCEDMPEDETNCIQTDDCRLALALCSRDFYGDPASQMTVIGITGTSGKTTTSYLMKHLLEAKLGAKVGLIGTNGNYIGDQVFHTEYTTPESNDLHKLFRRMADAGCTHVVMEVSSHSLALERVAGVHYNVAVYTNLSQDHLDFHKTMENYAAAKRLLFSRCDTGCFNLDDDWTDFMLRGADCRVFTYGEANGRADLAAKDVSLSASGVRFTAVHGEEEVQTFLGIPGSFSVYNALAVMSVGLSLGISLSDCADAMRDAQGVKGRMELVPTDGDYTVLIDYCHKPDALEKSLQSLRPVTKGRLIVLFGCGGDRDRLKRPVMGEIAAKNADLVIVTSDNPRTEEPMAIIEEIVAGMKEYRTPTQVICSREEAIAWALDNARPGDVILLAGKGHEDYQVMGHQKRHLDEREVVADVLKRRIAAP